MYINHYFMALSTSYLMVWVTLITYNLLDMIPDQTAQISQMPLCNSCMTLFN